MTTLVTGAAGLIGASVVRQSVAAGEAVVATDISAAESNGIAVLPLDICDREQILSVCRRHSVRRIIHLAALITDNTYSNPLLALRVNVVGTGNIFDAARELGLEKVVYASSVAVYGPASLYEKPVDEDTPLMPSNLYGATKLVDEVIARHYQEAYGVRSVGLRPLYAFGPGRYTGAVGQFNKVVRSAALGQTIQWMRTFRAGTILSPVHVDDMAGAFLHASRCGPLPERFYNIGSAEKLTEDQMIAAVRAVAPVPVAVEEVPTSAEYALSIPVIDCQRFIRDSGFKLRFDFEGAVRHSMNHYTGLP